MFPMYILIVTVKVLCNYGTKIKHSAEKRCNIKYDCKVEKNLCK